MQNDSQLRATTPGEVVEDLVSQMVELAGSGILLELPIPRRGIEFDKPLAEPVEIRSG